MRLDFMKPTTPAFLLARLEQLWTDVPRYKPLSVGVVLLGLVPASRHPTIWFCFGRYRR
jgi:hypothetical protein